MEISFYIENEAEEIIYPRTAQELDAMLEGKVNNIEVDGKKWCVLAIDSNRTYRNTDKKGGGYIKFYPNCKSLSGDMTKQKVYRIYTDLDENGNAIYTVHNGLGKGTDNITKDECKMFVAAASTMVDVKDKGSMTLFDVFDYDLKHDTTSEYTVQSGKSGKSSKIIKVSTKNIEERVKGTNLEQFLDIHYDGKRKL